MNLSMKLMSCGIMAISAAACGPVDPGGSIKDYLVIANHARETHEIVVIRGDCLSACVLKFMPGVDVRLAADVRVGVHETNAVPHGLSYDQGIRSNLASAFVRGLVRPCVRSLFHEEAWYRERITYVPAAAILAACPDIRPL